MPGGNWWTHPLSASRRLLNPGPRCCWWPCGRQGGGFFAGAFEVECIGEQVGHASAVKSCDSAVHKGLFALLLASLATAEQLDVRTELERLWASNAFIALFEI